MKHLTRARMRIAAFLMCPLLIAAAALPSYAEEGNGTEPEETGETEYVTMYYEGTPGCMQIGEPYGTASLITEERAGRSALRAAASAEGSSVYIAYNGKWINYDAYTTPMFTARTETGTYIALCGQPDTKQPPDGATWTVSTINNDLLKSILLLTPGNELYLYHGDNLFPGASEDEKYAYVHALLGLVYQGSITGLTEQHVQEIRALLSTIQNALESDSQFGVEWRRVIAKYRLYVAYTGEAYQDIMWVEPTAVSLSVQKASSDPAYGASLAGAVFAIYDSEANAKEAQSINSGRAEAETTGKEIATLETGEDGMTGSYETAMGEYWAYELRAPKGYLRSEECVYINAAGEGMAYVFSSVDQPAAGMAAVTKASADPAVTENNSLYSMEGIRYTLFSDPECTAAANNASGSTAVITLQEDGTGNVLKMNAGTYYVKETEVPAGSGYRISGEVKTLKVVAGETAAAEFRNAAQTCPVGLLLLKKDAETGSAQGNAVLEGAEYTVAYYDNYTGEGDPLETWIFRTDTDGKIVLDEDHKVSGNPLYSQNGKYVIPAGTVTVRETKASPGYQIDPNVYTIVFSPGEDGAIRCGTGRWNAENSCQDTEIVSTEKIIKGGVKFLKIDEETKGLPNNERVTLQGAEITIYNNSGQPVTVGDHLSGKGEAVAVLVTDESGNASSAADLLPYGSYYAEETKPSEGYTLNTEWRCDFEINEDGLIIDLTGEKSVLPQQIKRADLKVLKLDIDGAGMAGIPFRVALLDEEGKIRESHIIATDENGCFDTSKRAKTGEKVNGLDGYYSEKGFSDESVLTGETGLWFGDPAAQSEGRGSLVPGNYLVEELPCAANKGMELLSQQLFLDAEGDPEQEGFEDGRVYDLSHTFINLRIHPETDLTDDASGTKTVTTGKNITVTDWIYFDHLRVGTEYMILTEFYYIDPEGNTSLIGQNMVNYTPSETDGTMTASGTIESQAVLNTERLSGGIIAAADMFYIIKEGTYYELVSHNKDLTEERQILYVPEPVPEETPAPAPTETPAPTGTPEPHPSEKVKPAPSAIQTGDPSRPALWMTGLLAGVFLVSVLAVQRKRNRRDRPAGN